MGIWETFTDLVDAATPWSTAEAEAPASEEQESKDQKADESKDEDSSDDAEEEDAEEEDDEEIVDPKETLEEECKNSKQCAPAKHHFDECVERVTKQEEDGGAKEDCVEEFFHLAHCATQCAAPKLWATLK